jgi:hypothetical protein
MVKPTHLTRYWVEFVKEEGKALPPGVVLGVGVTAYGQDDALTIVADRVFAGELPSVARLTEDVDVSTLDQGHVIPNMEPPVYRGVWFPVGYR